MISLRQMKLRNVQNVAASKTALIELPIGPRYHAIILEHGYASGTNTIAAAATNISAIRLKTNSVVRRRYSGTQLRDTNLFHGTIYGGEGVPNTSPGSSFGIFFAEPWRKDVAAQLFGALPTVWQTGRLTSLQIEVDLGAASTPTLVASALVDDGIPAMLNGQSAPPIIEQLNFDVPAAGTAFDVSTLEKRGVLLQLSLYADSGASEQATNIEFRKNGQIIKEFTKSANFALLTNNEMYPTASGRTAKITDIVHDINDVLANGEDLSSAAELTLRIEAANAMSGTVTGIIQRVVPLN